MNSKHCLGRIAADQSRRGFLQKSSVGFGWLALNGLLSDQAFTGERTTNDGESHHAPRAKNVVLCFMDGGPSHVDTFDPKPMLAKHQGKKIGESAVSTRSQSAPNRVWLGSPWKFHKRGESGLPVSELFPHIAGVADEICVVRSMLGQLPLHGQQALLMHTGRITGQAPSFGAWISYGLGSENQNLPGYVLLNNDWVPNGGLENFGSSFLPASHQATMLRPTGAPVDNIKASDALELQKRKLALLAQQDREFAQTTANSAAIEGAIANYETAFRMQSAIPLISDINTEPEHIQKMYGVDSKDEHQRLYATQAIRARRLIEAGVRFVEITCPSFDGNNSPWDQHSQLVNNHKKNARVTEKSVAALITDLKQRGLLDETIVIWAGEMGRTPHTPKVTKTGGRDHHVDGYTIFFAGGGFRRGMAYGATDEYGNTVVEDQADIHDIHATVLHQLGVDHERLTFRHGGRDQSLTDVHGRVLNDLLS
ncbi:MAG: sulfatase [Planctomycetaceae bacterium]|nr:sulfatase [Planctomycetaceae bacterium]